jgi:hypothetical protein
MMWHILAIILSLNNSIKSIIEWIYKYTISISLNKLKYTGKIPENKYYTTIIQLKKSITMANNKYSKSYQIIHHDKYSL